MARTRDIRLRLNSPRPSEATTRLVTNAINNGLAEKMEVKRCSYEKIGILTFQLDPDDPRHDVEVLATLTSVVDTPWMTELL